MIGRDWKRSSKPAPSRTAVHPARGRLSSKIEGTRASLSDLVVFEAAGAPASDRSDVREIANYITAIEHGRNRLRDLPLSLRFIRELHMILMCDVRGAMQNPGEFERFRIGSVAPGATMRDATYVPPPVPKIHAALDAFEKYLHELLFFVLHLEHVLEEPLLYLSAYFEKNREEYYRRLFEVSSKGAWQEWIAYFFEALPSRRMTP